MNGPFGVCNIDPAKLIAERRSAEADDGKIEPCFAERFEAHVLGVHLHQNLSEGLWCGIPAVERIACIGEWNSGGNG